jgi:hypothetical protein
VFHIGLAGVYYGCFLLVSVFRCAQPRHFEQWLKKHDLFLSAKFADQLPNGRLRKHEELLVLRSNELVQIEKIMEDNVAKFSNVVESSLLSKIEAVMDDKIEKMLSK